MRESMGLEMRQEFENAADAVEETFEPAPVVTTAPAFPVEVMEKFHVTVSSLKEMAARYTGLKINGLADKQGHALARSARLELKDARILIDKTRKAENEEAQQFIKTCNNVAKYLTGIISPVEDALDAEEAAYNAEVEAEKGRKQAEAAAALQKRIEALQAVQQPFTLAEITLMTDTQFGFLLATATDAFQAKEKIRIEAEAALAKQEAERLEAERKAAEAKAEADRIERERFEAEKAAQAKAAADLAAEKAKLQAEKDAFEAKQRAADQAQREKQIAEDAAAKAKADAERKAKEDQERAAREQAEAAARAKAAEAAKPDAEKVFALAKVIREIGLPKLATEAGRATMTEIEASITKFATFIESKAKALSPIINPFAP